MDSTIGWLLDVTVEQNAATLWIKTTEAEILRLTDTYEPNFSVMPKDEDAGHSSWFQSYYNRVERSISLLWCFRSISFQSYYNRVERTRDQSA